MTDHIAGVCPVCNVEIRRPWRWSAQAFGRQTLIHFSCLAAWNRVIGAWHTELADGSSAPQEEAQAQVTEDEVAAGAEVLANSLCIDAPKLPALSWHGTVRVVLEAARRASKRKEQA